MPSVDNRIFPVEKQGGIHHGKTNIHVENVCDQLKLLTVSTYEEEYFNQTSDATHEFTDEITSNRIETMKVLGVQDMDGDTFLHQVIILEQTNIAIKIIQLLCNSDLLNICNCLFQTPLHLAVLTRQTIIVRRVLEAGARTDLQDHRAFHNSTEVVRILLNGGVDINAGDAKSGRTILHWAAECGKGELVDLLLSRKDVDVNSETYEGITAFELAEANGHLEIIRKFCEKN
ncbi:hypothetical protein CHS0354_018715 [Potamilus streckersoni]|uniref:Uncharacterized protein n=1 Tax=Potamilus streckersoni TaxID=2493646 RepID=A0AAE0RQ50_9BIVA|nr:hypothetical protein CHS0354_018715 [Potamilus streckersoni]